MQQKETSASPNAWMSSPQILQAPPFLNIITRTALTSDPCTIVRSWCKRRERKKKKSRVFPKSMASAAVICDLACFSQLCHSYLHFLGIASRLALFPSAWLRWCANGQLLLYGNSKGTHFLDLRNTQWLPSPPQKPCRKHTHHNWPYVVSPYVNWDIALPYLVLFVWFHNNQFTDFQHLHIPESSDLMALIES